MDTFFSLLVLNKIIPKFVKTARVSISAIHKVYDQKVVKGDVKRFSVYTQRHVTYETPMINTAEKNINMKAER